MVGERSTNWNKENCQWLRNTLFLYITLWTLDKACFGGPLQETPWQVFPFKLEISWNDGSYQFKRDNGLICFNCPLKALLWITCPLGSKLASGYFPESLFTPAGFFQPSLPFQRGWILDNMPKWLGLPLSPPHNRQDWSAFRGVNRATQEQFQSHTLSTHQILRPILGQQMLGASKPHHQGSVHPAWRKVRSRLQRTSLI